MTIHMTQMSESAIEIKHSYIHQNAYKVFCDIFDWLNYQQNYLFQSPYRVSIRVVLFEVSCISYVTTCTLQFSHMLSLYNGTCRTTSVLTINSATLEAALTITSNDVRIWWRFLCFNEHLQIRNIIAFSTFVLYYYVIVSSLPALLCLSEPL